MTKAESFSYFSIEAKVGEQYVATVMLKLNDVADAEKYIDNYALTSET